MIGYCWDRMGTEWGYNGGMTNQRDAMGQYPHIMDM